MKLGDVFDKSGSKIGEIHSEAPSSDLGCLGILLIPVLIICGIIVWPALFQSSETLNSEEAFLPCLILGIILATDTLLTLIGIWLTTVTIGNFVETFLGCFVSSILIGSIIIIIFFHILVEPVSFAAVLLIIFIIFFLQMLPSLIMTIIIRIIHYHRWH